MSEDTRGHKPHCEDEEEECISVKGCRRQKYPVKVRLEDDCDPIPVKLDQGCDPIEVILKQKHCDPLEVTLKQKHCEPLKVTLPCDVCVGVKNCDEDEPLKVQIMNSPPPPAADTNQFVFNGTSWEPELTPSRFLPLDNVTIVGTGVVWTPTPGTKFRLMGFQITSALAGQIDFHDGIGGPIIYSVVVVAGVPASSPVMGNGILSSTVNNPLSLTFSGGPGVTTFINGALVGQDSLP